MSVLAKLKEMNSFTYTERGIAEYLLANKYELAGITIADVTRETYSSNASVIRLCRKIGVNSFRSLRMLIIKESERQRKESKAVNVNFPFDNAADVDDITGAIADLMTETVRSMKELNLAAQLKQFSCLIQSAQHIYYYAMGDTLLTVKSFVNRLLKLEIQAFQADENKEELRVRTKLMQNRDIFVCVSYSGRNIPSKAEIVRMRQRDVKMILLTSAKDVWGFDLIIQIPKCEHSYDEKISTFYSQTAFAYIFNCVYSIIYSSRGKSVKK